MTRTRGTEKQYIEIAEQILVRYQEESSLTWGDDVLKFCEWFLERSKDWSFATWRLYKAAIIFFMKNNGPKEAVSFLDAAKWSSSAYKKGSRNTSAQKAKSFPKKDLDKLLSTLNTKRGQFDQLLSLWLFVGLMVGLRPSEWDTAIVENDILIVQNAKRTNGRSFGDKRQILLTNITDAEKDRLLAFLDQFDEFKKQGFSYQYIYDRCRKRMWEISRLALPRRKVYPTLYSCRHQVAAELKSSGYTLKEIAVLFGHASDATATRHYGHASQGSGKFDKIQAPVEDLGRIREKKKGYDPKNKQSKREIAR